MRNFVECKAFNGQPSLNLKSNFSSALLLLSSDDDSHYQVFADSFSLSFFLSSSSLIKFG